MKASAMPRGVGTIKEASLSPDSGFRSDSREGHFTIQMSAPPRDDNPCSLCCDRTHAVSQLPTCLHSFCQLCLEQLCQSPLQSCPKCQSNVQLSRIGLSPEACAAKEPVPMGSLDLLCAQCKTGSVVANCVQCIQLLCKNCSSSHDSSHAVFKLDDIGSGAGGAAQNCDEGDRHYGNKKALCTVGSSAPRKPFRLLGFSMSLRDIFQRKNGNGQDLCQEHGSEVARYYCQSCKQPICGLCSTQDGCLDYEFMMLSDVLKEQNDSMSFAVEQSKAKTNDLLSSVTHLDCVLCLLKEQFEESLSNIEKTFCFFSRVLLEDKLVDGYRRLGTVQTRIPSKAHANHSANQKLPGSTLVSSRLIDYLSTTSGPSLRGWTVALGLGGPDTEDDMSKVIVSNVSPALLTRTKMQYHCKFGKYGNEAGQFTDPSGVTVNYLNEVLVADANNHRIQIFDRNGNFKCVVDLDGKGEVGLVYPNRLAVNMQTGDIYITERSPTHQVQVYNQHGWFIRRFEAHILQHPWGIDKLGRIIVVECKVMRIVIFSSAGTVINQFIVDKRVNFPNGVAVNDSEEIFISDNRRHVVVFDYQGRYLRTIGGTGLTNYPIGVGINCAGEVVVADNHNNFQVTIFSQDGQLVRALESHVKHVLCFDIALLSSTSIVMSSKDFCVYVYHYVTPLGAFQESTNQFL